MRTRWLQLVQLLLFVALGGGVYLAWVSFQTGPVAGCGPGSGCSKVLQSRWAYWLGIPVSVPAVPAYLGLLITTVLLHPRQTSGVQRRAWMGAVVLSVVIAGAALWFIGLQAVVLKSFCKFCMMAHSCALVAVALLLGKLPRPGRTPTAPSLPEGTEPQGAAVGLPGGKLGWCVLAGLSGVAVLIAGQLLVEKKRFTVASLPAAEPARAPLRLPTNLAARLPSSTSAPIASAFATLSNTLAPTSKPGRPAVALNPTNPAIRIVQRTGPGEISLHDGLFNFQLSEVPMIGAPGARHIVVSLFDYTCHHCRDLHPKLVEVQKQYSNQLSIVSLVTPLASNCNPVVKIRLPDHTNACEYARLALAVWRVKREAFRPFDDWLFEPPRPVPVPEAKRYAAQLVGVDNLERALADAWITNHMQTNGYLYKTNYLRLKNSVLPELMIGSAVSFGPLNNPKDLTDLLADHLGLK
jgi:uncharacterized membrane protein/thiol-disulfide isomerase/thioredoxin